MDEKTIKVMNAIKSIDDIHVHIVSAEWYRHNVDMDYQSDKDVEIVQIDYLPDYYAYPQYMTTKEFMYKSVAELKDLLEIYYE